MDAGLHEIRQNKADQLEVMFLLCLAFLCFCLGIYYWIRLVGLFPVENWRFDLMGWQWRTFGASLAVLYPVAACGLWLQSRWGVILWIAGGLVEAGCYLFAASLFGYHSWLPALHLVLLLIYVAIQFYRHQLAKREDDSDFMAEY